ncbi:MAG: translation initiation factor IF-2 [Sulfolobales archaeon]
MERRLRSPIVVVLGHVDHGKTSLLDKIRGTAVVKKEAGEMTQHIGASFVPAHVIESIAEPLRKIINFKLQIPGLLFIDTPGHEAFANLRARGGSIADIAILVIDIIDGVKPQTIESIEILRSRRVPFLVAANKIDKIPGWRPYIDKPFLESIKMQDREVQKLLDDKVYSIAGSLLTLNFNAERFDRVRDFRRTVAIVPVSAKTGEGIPELLAVLAGLTQQYMSEKLRYAEGPAKGVILEVKEEPGLGTTLDVIIYDGIIRRGDLFVTAGVEGPIRSRVRALLLPKPLDEMRAPTDRFLSIESVYAASGVKIVAPDVESSIAGAPLRVVWSEEDVESVMKEVYEEVRELRIFSPDTAGVVLKADTLGTLEALVSMLRRRSIPIRIADVGPLNKNEALEALITRESNKYYGVIMLFNVGMHKDAKEIVEVNRIPVFSNNIIYRLVEDYLEWVEREKNEEIRRELDNIYRPGKIRVLPGYVFRRSEPAIVGVEVLGGVIRPGYPLMREDGKRIGIIMQIQERGKALDIARTGSSVAISIRGNVLVGRHFDEGDILYTDIPEKHAIDLVERFWNYISDDEKLVLKEIVEIKRKVDKTYALSIYLKLRSLK